MHYNGPFGSLMEVEGASTFIFLSQKSWIDDERFNLIAFHNQPVAISVYFSLLFPFHVLYSPFLSCSLLAVTQIRGHIVGSSPPSPLLYMPCIFIARRVRQLLPSSIRVELCLPTL